MSFHYVQLGWSSVQSPKLYDHDRQVLRLKASQHSPAIRALVVRCAALILLPIASLSATAQQVSGGSSPVHSASTSSHAAIAANYGKLPLSFEKNQGQIDPQVRFLSRGNGYSLFLTDSAAVLSLHKPEAPLAAGLNSNSDVSVRPAAKQSISFKTDVVRMELAGASHDLHVVGDSQLPGTANYFIGKDPAKWHSNVPTYGKVRYNNVYPGVDLVYYGNQGELEYDFVVGPNADPHRIGLHFAGAKKLKLDSNGNLQVTAKNGQVEFHKPIVYQTIDGKRRQVEGSFTLLSRSTVSFKLGPYDRSQEVVIDPTLAYSTYLGGSNGDDYGTAIATDASGDAYVVGAVYATDFPTTAGVYQAVNKAPAANLFDAFVAKLDPTGTALLYATYLGGSGNTSQAGTMNHGDYPESIAVDASGNAYVAGTAYSADFPVTAGAFQTTNHAAANGVPNGFIAKLNATGTSLIYSTYLGGSGVSGHAGSGGVGSLVSYGDGCSSIAIDAAGDAYVSGGAYSADFPVTAGAFQSVNRAASIQFPNAFVTKLAPSGDSLLYSTYVGGSGADGAAALVIDSAGDAYIAGATYSSDFPVTSGAFQSTNKALGTLNSNAFVTKLNPSGSGLVFSTYLGGSSNVNGPAFPNNNGDFAVSLAVDSDNNVYAFGLTGSSDFPVTVGAYQTTNKAYQNNTGDTFFLTKLNPTGTNEIYSTFVGGSQQDSSLHGLAVDAAGNAYFTGNAFGNDFPVSSDALQSSPPCVLATNGAIKEYFNPVVAELSADGSALVYSSYLGGSGSVIFSSGSTTTSACDTAYALTLESTGNLLVTGSAFSADFPVTSGAYQTANHSIDSAFISKMTFQSAEQAAATPVFSPPGGTYATPQSVIITDATAGATVYYTVDGSAPITSSTIYTSAVTVSSTETLKAKAAASSYADSAVATATYTISISPPAATPAFSPAAGTYTSAQTVTISDTTAGAAIHYTTDGTTPTSSSTTYTGPVSVTSTETIQAIAIATGYSNSAVTSATYTINLPPPVAATPTFSPAAGSYISVQSVTISDATSGATIYYTIDGSTPTSNSTKYAGPISVGSSETISAIAVASGYTNSAVATSQYVINLPTADFSIGLSSGTLTLTSGQSATVTLTATPANGFSQAITFSCSGLPSNDSCSFSPSTITPSGAPATTTLTVSESTTAATHTPFALWPGAPGGTLAMMFCWLGWKRRRKIGPVLFALALMVGLSTFVGCGGGTSSTTGPPKTTYNATITATSGSLSHTTPLTITQ